MVTENFRDLEIKCKTARKDLISDGSHGSQHRET